MGVEVIGIDHVYITVRDLRRSEGFYDRVVPILGFRKGWGDVGGDPHLHYYNRHFGYSVRPARKVPLTTTRTPQGCTFCFRVVDEAAVERAATELREAGVEATKPRYNPEYDPDYYATFFEDPDGVRLEVANFRERRRRLMHDWVRSE